MQELPGPELCKVTTSKFMGRLSELTRLPGLSGKPPPVFGCALLSPFTAGLAVH